MGARNLQNMACMALTLSAHLSSHRSYFKCSIPMWAQSTALRSTALDREDGGASGDGNGRRLVEANGEMKLPLIIFSTHLPSPSHSCDLP